VRPLYLWLLAFACLPPSLALSQEVPPKMTAGSPEMLDGRLIDIGGGRRLNMVCIGGIEVDDALEMSEQIDL